MINDQRIGKDLEGSVRGLICCTILEFPEEMDEKYKKKLGIACLRKI
jgi:hypothetical protein